MKILIWGNTFPLVGGVERFIDHLGHALHERGYKVCVVSDGKEVGQLTDRPFPVYTLPIAQPVMENDPSGLLNSIQHAKRLVKDISPDIIHYNPSGLGNLIFSLMVKGLDIPIATTLHLDLNMLEDEGALERILNKSSQITVVSPFIHALGKTLGFRTLDDMLLIENAIPAQSKYVSPPKGKVIFALGRLVHEKGLDLLIEAMQSVVQFHPGARLNIAGRGQEVLDLEERIKELGLEKNVALIGWVLPENVHHEMTSSNLVVMPSRWEEPFGLVCVEAAVAGRPCVAFAVGGITDSIVDGVTGELVPAQDVIQLAAKIVNLLDEPERADEMGRNALQRYQNLDRFEAMIDAYESLFWEMGKASET